MTPPSPLAPVDHVGLDNMNELLLWSLWQILPGDMVSPGLSRLRTSHKLISYPEITDCLEHMFAFNIFTEIPNLHL